MCDTPAGGFQCNQSVSHFWGQYSPYFAVPSEVSPVVPAGCSVNFVQVLSRHGARNPTLGKSVLYGALIARIHQSVKEYGEGFAFVKDYNYTLGADQLTALGQQEMVNSGIQFYTRYRDLARKITPFVRSSGQDRVVHSAQNWTDGFHQTRLADKQSSPDSFPYPMVIIPEAPGVNNTLSYGLCTAFKGSKSADAAQAKFLATFAGALADRLNRGLPGANLSLADTISIMDMCPYDTVDDISGKLSPFCSLFTEDEWKSYDYFQSLGKWYGYGDGNELGPTQGVGWVNELIARLTGSAVRDSTSTNATLDSSPSTFPLDAVLYADFSHDNDMAGVFAALGLYNATSPLSTSTRESTADTKGYSASWTVPFGARMYVEKMTCSGSKDELVRILVNGRVIPLQSCGADSSGRCALASFVDSLSFARGGGHWGRCFV